MATQYWGAGRIGTHQSVAYTGTAGTVANTITAGVQKVRVCATSACYIAIGVSPTATTAGIYMPADTVEYFTVAAGEKVSAIQSSAGGILHVTEIS
jgi:hypothetical protein